MKSIKKIFVTITISLIFVCNNMYAHYDSSKDKYDILFIGASYFTYNDLTGLMENILNDCGKKANIELHTTGGPYLHNHANSSLTKAIIIARANPVESLRYE